MNRNCFPDHDESEQGGDLAHQAQYVSGLMRELCDHAPAAGRPNYPLGDRLAGAALAVYYDVNHKALVEILKVHAGDHPLRLPSAAAALRCLRDPAMTTVLDDLVIRSASPLVSVERDFAIGAGDFPPLDDRGWASSRRIYASGKSPQSPQIRAHICCGTKTGIVTAAAATAGLAHRAPFLPRLVETTARHFDVRQVLADERYLSRANLSVIEKAGAQPVVRFKPNSVSHPHDSVWERNFRFYRDCRGEFMETYRKHRIVRAVFLAIRARFGDQVRFRSERAHLNVMLLKIVIHNLCVLAKATRDLGIKVDFGAVPDEGYGQMPMAA